jgi:hypothetical protein
MTRKHECPDTGAARDSQWISLFKAYAHITAVVGEPSLADERLRQALDDGRLRHRVGCAYIGFPARLEVINRPAPSGFWCGRTGVTWREDFAIRTENAGGFYEAHRVDVFADDLFSLWPKVGPGSHSLLGGLSGRPRQYNREDILIEAAVFVVIHSLPKTQSKLIESLFEILGDRAPQLTLMKEIIGPFYTRIKSELDRKKTGRK